VQPDEVLELRASSQGVEGQILPPTISRLRRVISLERPESFRFDTMP
jgi:hypothetical protein